MTYIVIFWLTAPPVTTRYTALHGLAAHKTLTQVPPSSKTKAQIATKFYGAAAQKTYLILIKVVRT
jgi:hypothetical protein